ncbi:lysM and putative peptidoglycan-binding domain-containing protein 3 isoform X1 [Hydra vulgaris]|uniref:LysM and putative peptidoglycan-binding domain-containing protein 3 isoform X1 n=2 Tax=Hydra vulgaris TaxID=6087 RepID=A0ABM4DA52_HYDVU
MSLPKFSIQNHQNGTINKNIQKLPENYFYDEEVYSLNFPSVSNDLKVKLQEDMQNRSRVTQKISNNEDKCLFGEKSAFIHINVKDSDTLQKLALMFNCKISDIKLANKIYKEQDLHGLKTIKIPVLPNSILHEEFCKNEESEQSLKNQQPSDTTKESFRMENFDIKNELDYLSDDNDTFDEQSELRSLLADNSVKHVKTGQFVVDQHDLNIVDYLNVIDKRIEQSCAVLDSTTVSNDEVLNLIKTDFVFPNVQKSSVESLGSLGSYKWTHYFFCFCFIAVICPTVGFLLYKFKIQ